MIEFINFSKIYKGGKKAVTNLNLTVENGDLCAFVGHNGAGKTTSLKCLTGILDFEEGDIIVDGLSVKTNKIKIQKEMAYIPDNPDLYENLKGIDYINFIADIYKVSKEDREINIKKYGDLFEITKDLGASISSYSHGMKQKLAIIFAMVHKPKILILDEPFVGLDPIAAIKLKEIMQELCANGSSIFFSTHVLDVAEKICNKVAIIKGGVLLASGTMSEIKGERTLEEIYVEMSANE